jgi:putative ABC transport system permease protein
MKYLKMFELAVKYLIRYRRRYLFLFIAMGFGFSLITFITSVKDGMTENVYLTAQSHYAGDLVVLADDADIGKSNRIKGPEADIIADVIQKSQLNPERVVYRTTYSERGTIFYNGMSILLKYVVGVDWENEQDFFENITYQEAPVEPLDIDENTMVLSSPVAKQLGLRVGDSVVLEQPTIDGYKNTHVFIIRAIIEDESIFGYYKAFVSREMLNTITGYGENACSTIGLFFNDRGSIAKKEKVLYDELSKYLQMGPMISTREERSEATSGKKWEGGLFFVLTLDILLSEVAELLGALNLITYFLYVVMLLIIFVSASVTYRLILYERTREIGTMMALGFYGFDIRLILLFETICLGIISLAAGFVLAMIAGWVLSFFTFASIPSFEIFTKDGSLVPLYLIQTIAVNVLAVFCILFPAVWFPVYRSSRAELPEMLSGGMKT